MKTKQLIFIDDSGDAGIKAHSSNYLVMSAIVFNDDLIAEEVALEMRKFRRRINWTDDHEFKFNKTKKDYIKEILTIASKYNFSIYAVIIEKNKLKQPPKDLYNSTISELLRLIPLSNSSIKIDGHSGTNYMKHAISRVRKNANVDPKQIKDIKFADSKENILIQLSDLVASSIFRSTQNNKSDRIDYINIIKNHITEIRYS